MRHIKHGPLYYAYDIGRYGRTFAFNEIVSAYGLIRGIWIFCVAYRTHRHIR